MSKVRDPLIKLFGADIHFPATPSSDDFDHLHPPPDTCVVPMDESKVDDSSNVCRSEENMGLAPTPGEYVNIVSNVEEEQCVEPDAGNQEKALKRPDKVIPCPRCRSLNTKFCYFNNYNVNQPRHFCKNCQRYWTAGGTIRNVPVGAGKRKNKQLPLHYIQEITSEGIPHAQADSHVSACPFVQPNLSFSIPPISLEGKDETAKLCLSPLCESMVSMFHQNGVELSPVRAAEEPSSSVSSISSTTLNELELPCKEAAQIRPPMLYYAAGLTQPGEQIQSSVLPVEDALVFPVIPYWGCIPVFNNTALPISLPGCNEQLSSLCATDSSCSSSSSPNLGKHLRETNVSGEEKIEKCLWAPKSKKIENMDTAAKCSILTSLGLTPGKSEPILKGVFKPRPESSKDTSGEKAPMISNTAALSGAQSFEESTLY